MAEKKVFTVDFAGEQPVQVVENQTILQAALAAGIPHYHACGGQGKCSTCRILVMEGAAQLSAPTRRELAMRERMHFPPGVRLACQTRVTGEQVQVQRLIRDDVDFLLYIGPGTGDEIQKLGEERDLVLFFLDIRKFTQFMGCHLAFDVMHILRRLFRIFQKAIEEHGKGKIIETAGDGLYAVFGLEENIRRATESAVKAGLQILADLETFNINYLQVYFNYRAELGIGLHAGRVILGTTGLGLNRNLSVMGLPVNVAARLQAATRHLNNSFVVSEEAFSLLAHPPENAASATIRLDGVPGEQKVRLLGNPFE